MKASGAARSASSVVVVGVVLAGATDHDLVLLDRDDHVAVTGPMLGVHRVVGDGGVQPQAVALVAVIERALELALGDARGARAAPAAAAAATATAGGLRGLLLLGVPAPVEGGPPPPARPPPRG